VVTHREGLRDLSEVAGRPFRRTAYCCTAVFRCFPVSVSVSPVSPPPGRGGGGGGGGGGCRWVLMSSPEEFSVLQQTAAAQASQQASRQQWSALDEAEENTDAGPRGADL
jgi:hypothetical protein